MPNIKNFLSAATNFIESFTDDVKPPLHVGEVMSCWLYLTFLEEIIIYEEVAINTTSNENVKDLFIEAKEIAESHKKELMTFLKQEGVPLPNQPQDKPHTEQSAIPLGAKFTDSELMNALAMNFATVITMNAQALSHAIRSDVSIMFIKFQMDKLFLSQKVKKLMYLRGWIKIPPAYLAPGAPNGRSNESS